MDRRRARNPPARPLVLIVDDDPDTREMYAACLSAMGWDAIGAGDGGDAYQQAWEFHPDVIVTDLSLPRADGRDLMGRLKQDTRTRDIPVLVLTGYEAPDLQTRAEREGCAAFLVKPCLPEELATKVRQVLDVAASTPSRR